MPANLSISQQARNALAERDLERFWELRMEKRDPVARIGYALWVSSAEKLKRTIEGGDPVYWNHRGYAYWDAMARSTVVNIAVGLERGGFRGSFIETRDKIREIGLKVARWHAIYVNHDYQNNIGRVPGQLSLQQMADYHHQVFREFNIPADFYGGTWLRSVPDPVELSVYGHLYCHDCDTPRGYKGIGQ
ncbi:hypothetical protein [Marinimicrobium agarilyticum]|uniref:hypothetical protein n=1 Tax=Marinimicrobium agarilyticum TaxID=306546 RepID=UPI001B7F9841|nr:hypothetical protein [Marinimicrobium agarilyticum]